MPCGRADKTIHTVKASGKAPERKVMYIEFRFLFIMIIEEEKT